MSQGVYAGVDIGGTKTAVLLSKEPPALISRLEFPTRPEEGPQRALDLIVRSLRESLASRGIADGELKAIGVSCGGPLNPETGVIHAPPNLWTWVDVPITSILEREFDVPCALENDANAGAVAEHRFGAGRGTRNMIFLTMGTGLGAGIIADGRLYTGTTDSAGEIGHVRLTRTGPVGYHKAGSVEGWASGAGIAQVAAKSAAAALKKGQPSGLSECLSAANGITAKQVGEAAKSGDALAIQIVRAAGRKLGEGLAILVDILNPERIVIGGLGMRFGELLLEPARQVMRREAIASSAAVCEVVPASLSENIGDVAALCVAMGMR
jgi:glucokinase